MFSPLTAGGITEDILQSSDICLSCLAGKGYFFAPENEISHHHITFYHNSGIYHAC